MTLLLSIHHELIATSSSPLRNIITDNSAPLFLTSQTVPVLYESRRCQFNVHAAADVASPRRPSMAGDVTLRTALAQTDDVYV